MNALGVEMNVGISFGLRELFGMVKDVMSEVISFQ